MLFHFSLTENYFDKDLRKNILFKVKMAQNTPKKFIRSTTVFFWNNFPLSDLIGQIYNELTSFNVKFHLDQDMLILCVQASTYDPPKTPSHFHSPHLLFHEHHKPYSHKLYKRQISHKVTFIWLFFFVVS